MVKAALRGGASGLRINSPQDVRTTRQLTGIPILACNKMLASELADLHHAQHPRGGGPAPRRGGPGGLGLHAAAARAASSPRRLSPPSTRRAGWRWPTCPCVEEAAAAVAAGADILATTLAADFDVEFVRALAGFGLPVLAEGRINTPDAARRALDAGAWAVCVGSAITRPHLLTEQFKNALGT